MTSPAALPDERRAGYAFCPVDDFWFRPAYTEGTCPLCGEVADPEEQTVVSRSWYGLAGLALLSLVMLALVLVMYFRG